MANPWITHVKKYAKTHKISYGDAISKARATYKKKGMKGKGDDDDSPKKRNRIYKSWMKYLK